MSRSTIRDKTGHEWVVEIDEQPADDLLPFSLVNFYVFHPTSISKKYPHPIGHGHLSIQVKDATTAKIEDWKVIPKLQNRGIGSSLLDLIEVWARNHGIKKLIGDLSSIDADRFNKLRHIYEKRSYIFRLNSTREKRGSIFVGKIKKSLENSIY